MDVPPLDSQFISVALLPNRPVTVASGFNIMLGQYSLVPGICLHPLCLGACLCLFLTHVDVWVSLDFRVLDTQNRKIFLGRQARYYQYKWWHIK